MGVITERDLLEKIVKPVKNPIQISAKEIMSLPVPTIDSGQPLTEALRTMKKANIQRLAVFRKGKLIGMLAIKLPSKP